MSRDPHMLGRVQDSMFTCPQQVSYKVPSSYHLTHHLKCASVKTKDSLSSIIYGFTSWPCMRSCDMMCVMMYKNVNMPATHDDDNRLMMILLCFCLHNCKSRYPVWSLKPLGEDESPQSDIWALWTALVVCPSYISWCWLHWSSILTPLYFEIHNILHVKSAYYKLLTAFWVFIHRIFNFGL